jgi:hypothetical protein
MIQKDRSYYDVIAYGLEGGSFQAFVDGYEASKYNVLNVDGFKWDPNIQIDFTYEQLRAELGIATLPTYVDVDSPAPYKSQDGFVIGTNKIPRFKHGFAINEKIIREQMVMLKRLEGRGLDDRTKKLLMDLLFDSVNKLVTGNYNALTYQRMQVVSTGQYSITAQNNPSGIAGLTFDFGIPAKNKATLTGTDRWWTNATHDATNEGTTSDPIRFLLDKYTDAVSRGLPSGHFEISLKLWNDMLAHTAVGKYVGHMGPGNYSLTDAEALNASGHMTREQKKSYIEQTIGCPIVVRDTVAVVESFNKGTKAIEKTTLPGFEITNVAYVPNGGIGTIKAVQPIAVPDPGARIAYLDGGRTVLKQTFNTDTNTQYISSECTALTVPSASNYMCVFKVTV